MDENSQLIIRDTSTEKNGKISGGYSSNGAGGITMKSGSTLVIEGGIITGNTGMNGGGVYSESADVRMEGGQIVENTANYGGGIYLREGNASVTDGIIRGNTAKADGGGIYGDSASHLELTGTKIDKNQAGRYGGGIFAEGYLDCACELTLGGTVTVKENISDNSVNNLYLDEYSEGSVKIRENPTTPLVSGTSIGISAALAKGTDAVCISEEQISVSYFASDQSEYQVVEEPLGKKLYLEYVSGKKGEIASFAIPNMESCTINNNTVSVIMPIGTDLSKLTPEITVSGGASITPASGVEQDFTKPVTYKMISSDGTVQGWRVAVEENIGTTVMSVTVDGQSYYFDNAKTGWFKALDSSSDAEVKLYADWIADDNGNFLGTNSPETIRVNSNRKIKLDLNGHTIDRGRTESNASTDGYVIVVGQGAELTISDSGTGGKITGGYARTWNSAGTAGGIYVSYNAKVILEGGSICGNRGKGSNVAGGIYLGTGASLTMSGGSISDNYGIKGGGIAVSGGTVTITGGGITGNEAGINSSSYDENGGGIYADGSSTLNILGGKITDNMASDDGGGVYVKKTTSGQQAKVTLGGTPYIQENIDCCADGSYRKSDLFLGYGNETAVFSVDASKGLSLGAKIGIRSGYTGASVTVVAKEVANNYSGYFVSNEEKYSLNTVLSGGQYVIFLKRQVYPGVYLDIEEFVIPGATATNIDKDKKEVSVTMPAGTDVTRLKPEITVSDNAKVLPASGTERDFTNPVDYAVVSTQDDTWSNWNVKVTVEPSPKHTVTVNGGTGSGSYEEGKQVTVTALDAKDKIFSGWKVESGTLNEVDLSKKELTFTMPKTNVVLTATYTTPISKVAVTIDEPKGNVALAEKAQVTGTGEGILNMTPKVLWTPQPPTDGIVEFQENYTAVFSLGTQSGYEFSDYIKAIVNGKTAVIHTNEKNAMTVSYTFTTPKAKLLSIQQDAKVSGIASQTEIADMKLPSQVQITTEDPRITMADVNWDRTQCIDGTSYNKDATNSQSFKIKGTVILPEEIDQNGQTPETVLQVEVSAADQVAAPVPSKIGGTYTANQQIELTSSTPEAEIYYRVNGGSEQLYTGSIEVTGQTGVSKTTNISAYAKKAGMRQSETINVSYTISIPHRYHSVTVENGLGSGSYKVGDTVKIQSISDTGNKMFREWKVTQGTVNLQYEQTSKTAATFSMPDEDVVITGIYKTEVKSIELTADEPEGGKPLNQSISSDTEGVTIQAVTWKEEARTIGEAEEIDAAGYNTTYTAELTVSTKEEYVFKDGAEVLVKEKKAEILENADDTLKVSIQWTTPKAKLLKVVTPEAVEGVASHTAFESLPLPRTVSIETEDKSIRTANVKEWIQLGTNVYNPDSDDEQKFIVTGVLDWESLSEQVDTNGKSQIVQVMVTVIGTKKYTLEVQGGEGSGYYKEKADVTVRARDEIKELFLYWEVKKGDVELGDKMKDLEVQFQMPAEDVIIKGSYKSPVESVEINFNVPEGNKPLPSNITVSEPEKVEVTDSKWEPSAATAKYNTTYTWTAKISAREEYYLVDNVGVCINGQEATVKENEDGTLSVSGEWTTAKAKVTKVESPAAITVENGTAVNALGLPETVSITTEDNSKTKAAVTWKMPESTDYNPSLKTEQTFEVTGMLEWYGKQDSELTLDISEVEPFVKVQVTVLAEAVHYSVTVSNGEGSGNYKAGDTVRIAPISDKQDLFIRWEVESGGIEIQDNTFQMPNTDVKITGIYKTRLDGLTITMKQPEGNKPLPSATEAETTAGAKVTAITWSPEDEKAGYNKTYTMNATVSAEDGYVLSDNAEVSVNKEKAEVTKNEDGTLSVSYKWVTPKAKILSVKEPAAITGVANGTPANELPLPKTVDIVTEDNSKTSANVNWIMPEITEYNPELKETQTFTVTGVLEWFGQEESGQIFDTSEVSPFVQVEVTVGENTKYELVVDGGRGSGIYEAGETVTITAIEEKKALFKEWIVKSGDVVLEHPQEQEVQFTMPAGRVEITGTYKSVVDIIQITFDTPQGNKELPSDIKVSEGVKVTDTAWNPSDAKAEYNKAYTWTAKINAESGYQLSEDVEVSVNGKKAEIIKNEDGTLSLSMVWITPKVKVIKVENPAAIKGIPNGTPVEQFSLPETVQVQTEENKMITVKVNWMVPDISVYNPAEEKEQTFIVTGVLEWFGQEESSLKVDISGVSMSVKVKVTVAKKQKQEPTTQKPTRPQTTTQRPTNPETTQETTTPQETTPQEETTITPVTTGIPEPTVPQETNQEETATIPAIPAGEDATQPSTLTPPREKESLTTAPVPTMTKKETTTPVQTTEKRSETTVAETESGTERQTLTTTGKAQETYKKTSNAGKKVWVLIIGSTVLLAGGGAGVFFIRRRLK